MSNSQLTLSISEYRKMLVQLGRFSNSSEVQKIRAQIRNALAELLKEAKERILPESTSSKAQPALVPLRRPSLRRTKTS